MLRKVVLREFGFGRLLALRRLHLEPLLEIPPRAGRAGREDEARSSLRLRVFRALGSPDEVLLNSDDLLRVLLGRNRFRGWLFRLPVGLCLRLCLFLCHDRIERRFLRE